MWRAARFCDNPVDSASNILVTSSAACTGWRKSCAASAQSWATRFCLLRPWPLAVGAHSAICQSPSSHRGAGEFPIKRWPTGLTLSTCCAGDTNFSIMTGWRLRSGASLQGAGLEPGGRRTTGHSVPPGCLKPGARTFAGTFPTFHAFIFASPVCMLGCLRAASWIGDKLCSGQPRTLPFMPAGNRRLPCRPRSPNFRATS